MLKAFKHAGIPARVEAIKTWTQEVDRCSQKRKDLKKQFIDHCKNHPNGSKQDHKGRLKGHKERVVARGANEILSDTDSEDSQASLLRELDETEILLAKRKKELKRAEEDD